MRSVRRTARSRILTRVCQAVHRASKSASRRSRSAESSSAPKGAVAMNKVCNMSAPGDALAKVEGQLSRRAQESESASISCGTSLALPRLHGHHTSSFTKQKESDIDALPNEAPKWRPGVIGMLG